MLEHGSYIQRDVLCSTSEDFITVFDMLLTNSSLLVLVFHRNTIDDSTQSKNSLSTAFNLRFTENIFFSITK